MPVLPNLPMVSQAMPHCSGKILYKCIILQPNKYKKWRPYNYAKADEVDGEISSHRSTAKYRNNTDKINHAAIYTDKNTVCQMFIKSGYSQVHNLKC